MAYLAFPLALHVLNIHLSAAIARQTPTNGTIIDVMKLMHLQYDGVDWVARVVRYIVDLVQGDPAVGSGGHHVTDWAELLAVRPRTYLRMSLAMDLSMSSGRLPDKTDFLARLDGVRLSRSARLLRSIAEPRENLRAGGGGLGAEEEEAGEQRECRRPEEDRLRKATDHSPPHQAVSADGSSALQQSDNLGAGTVTTTDLQTLQDLERPGVGVGDDTSFADAFGTSDFSQEHAFSAAAGDLGDFQSLSADLDDFFDPAMGEDADNDGSSGGSSTGIFEADIDSIACLAC